MIYFKFILSGILLSLSSQIYAVQITVKDANDKPLKNVLVMLPGDNQTAKPVTLQQAKMSQRDKQFTPHILAVQQGTPVVFPNEDDIAHHVYSFSEAKQFEKKIYRGDDQTPVVFENAGIVKLGCNVHDWMLGYIFVVDSPFFALTDENGNATLDGLHSGVKSVKLWHPLLHDGEITEREIALQEHNAIQLETTLIEADDFDIDDLGTY
ncbi:methylamine utilization protein [Planctobacterium marinum]|uniref:methylamine utilization protein n=1 Tax=Planctobacterium marinum TaxID=1631968 RepID=UPI001E3AD2FF|nr:methylamine utilization protein [Planctobacterium marinum]MCC2605982.1 methylamine utilization protein [Planctobacterium marinum]